MSKIQDLLPGQEEWKQRVEEAKNAAFSEAARLKDQEVDRTVLGLYLELNSIYLGRLVLYQANDRSPQQLFWVERIEYPVAPPEPGKVGAVWPTIDQSRCGYWSAWSVHLSSYGGDEVKKTSLAALFAGAPQVRQFFNQHLDPAISQVI